MINENEIYSCGQLEFYNALSQSEKLKLHETSKQQQKKQEQHQQQEQQQHQQHQPHQKSNVKQLNAYIESPIEQLPQVKLETTELEIDAQLLNDLQKSNNIRAGPDVTNELPEVLFKRVAQKANPKTVTASVFKAIPAGGANKLLKPISGGNAFAATGHSGSVVAAVATAANPSTISIGGARAPQSVTASLIQPIASIKRDLFGKSQAIDRAIVAEPSVVTASLFQPRTNAIGGTSAASVTVFGTTKLSNNNSTIAAANATNNNNNNNTAANQLASRTEAMNKPFLMFTDDIRQLTSEYFYSPVKLQPTAFSFSCLAFFFSFLSFFPYFSFLFAHRLSKKPFFHRRRDQSCSHVRAFLPIQCTHRES